mgnify:FL=1
MFRNNISLNKFCEYKNIYLASFWGNYPLSSNYNVFKPINTLSQKINEISSQFTKYTIGIHIRRTDHINAIGKSPTELFIEKMKNELNKNENTHFYLASDSIEEKQTLKNTFGDKLITSFDETHRDTKKGIQDSLIDLYALSRTSHIYGSYDSSFSQTAALISNIGFTEIYKTGK